MKSTQISKYQNTNKAKQDQRGQKEASYYKTKVVNHDHRWNGNERQTERILELQTDRYFL